MADVVRAMEELQRKQFEAEQLRVANAHRDYVAQILSLTFDKGTAYTQILLLALYAGVFTLLSNVGADLPLRALWASCLALAVSLAFFGVNEVYKMVVGVLQGLEQRNLILAYPESSAFLKAFEAYQVKTRSKTARQGIIVWLVCLIGSGIPGVLAMLCLIYNLMARIFSLPLWPQ